MSNQNALSQTPSTGSEPAMRAARARGIRVVAATLAASALTVAVVTALRPGADRNDLSYEAVAAARDGTWASATTVGIALAVAAVTFGIATCVLASGRGGRTATVGAVLTGLGGIVFGGAIVAFGTLAWYVTDPAALPPESGAEFLAYIEGNFERIGVLLIPGFLLFTVGSLVLAVALWRSRSVPRWWPVIFAALTVGLFTGLDPRVMDGLQAAQTALLVVVAAYTWRLGRK